MTHEIKLNENFIEAVWTGAKNFEVRYNDRSYQMGDKIIFIPVDYAGVSIPHPIKKMVYEITYVLSGWGLKDNYVAFGIRRIQGEQEE